MKKILFLLLIISLTGLTQIFADHHKKQESKLKIPKSWEEYLSIKRKQKAFGVWSYQGKTTNVNTMS